MCTALPLAGAVVAFRGDLFHGISTLECDAGATGERVSVVLEQYDSARNPHNPGILRAAAAAKSID